MALTKNMVKCKINYTLTVKSPTSVVKPMQPSFYLQMNSRIHRQRQRVSSSPRTHQPITLLSHTHQSHFSSNPCTTLNSTHSPMPSSGRPAKPRPAQIIPPPPPKSHQDRTHSTSLPCSTTACLRSTTAIIQATLLHELRSTSKLPIYPHNLIPISANPHLPCPIHTYPI